MPRCKTCNIKFEAKFFNQKTCSKSCNSTYLDENPKKAIKKVSDKRKIQEDQYYNIVRPEYLKNNPNCVRCSEYDLKVKSQEIHHKNGREGERLLDTRFFMSSCKDCHKYIHAYPQEARVKGWLI